MASLLCGTTAMKETSDRFGSRRDYAPGYYARHPVMTPEMIRQLPAGRALVIRGGYSPVIARLPMAWKDPLYRHVRRTGQRAAALEAGAAPGALPPRPPGRWPARGQIAGDLGAAYPPGPADDPFGDPEPGDGAWYRWDRAAGAA